MKTLMTVIAATATLAYGCTMMHAWKTIPAPGGCEKCHKVEISANWALKIEPVRLSDNQGTPPFQRPEAGADASGRPVLPENMKFEEQPCFTCHAEPARDHLDLKGSYHQKAK